MKRDMPRVRDLKKLTTKEAARAYASENDYPISENGNNIVIGNRQLTYDTNGKLVYVD